MFSTSLLEPRLRTLAYSQWIRPIADLYPVGHKPMNASITMYELDQMVVAHTTSGPARYVRDDNVIKRGHFADCILVRLSRGGKVKGSFGRIANVELHEGDIYLSDLSQPVDIGVSHCEHINLLVPKKALGHTGRSLHGRLLRRDRLPCRMLTQHLLHLLELVADSRRTHISVLSRTTLAVLTRCLGISSREQDGQLRAETLQSRIFAHIESQLGDAELSAATLQEKFRVSRTQLYRLFEDIGGVQWCIRERRLQAAFRELCEGDGRSISEISFRLGFRTERQFQRSFRIRFNMTASSVRDGLFGLHRELASK